MERALGLVGHTDVALLEVAHWEDARLSFVGHPVALDVRDCLCDLNLATLLNDKPLAS